MDRAEMYEILRMMDECLSLPAHKSIHLADRIYRSYRFPVGGCCDVESAEWVQELVPEFGLSRQWFVETKNCICEIGETASGRRAILEIIAFDSPLLN